jgi:hypothetical protein
VLAGHAAVPNRVRGVCWTPLAFVGALAGALALAGCAQPPGFELSWRIADAHATDNELDKAPPLDAVKQCSDVGIFWVRVTAKLGEAVVWIDEFECASSVRSSIEAPPLEPGEYTLVVEGLRRNHEPWAFDSETEVPRIAHGEVSVTVSEGEPPVVDAVLRAPPGCDDGIDNDLDGMVDTQDPGCEVQTADGYGESNDAELTLFSLAVSFLDSSAVRPDKVGVNSIRLEVDGELLAEFAEYELDYSQWPWQLPLVAADYTEGTLTVTPIGDDGPMTVPRELEFSEQSVPYTVFDFDDESFLEPIIEPVSLVFDPGCSAGGSLVLETMRIRIADENGDVPPGLVLMKGPLQLDTTDGGGGWISFDCPPTSVLSNPLTWGSYNLEAQAVLAGVTCFETPELVELAPQPVSSQTIELERVMINGQPACPECSEDSDCLSMADANHCEAGLCVEKPGQ